MDLQCEDYITFATSIEDNTVSINKKSNDQTMSDTDNLRTAIIKGLKERASQITKELLKNSSPAKLIDEQIVPALDVVGKGYEEKRIFLPQLLMSAEAAKESFEAIKNEISKSGVSSEKKCVFIIATVEGDIHDIGKNIVKVMLENYGFDVIDLGKDVPPERIVESAIENKAPIVGLSALMTTTVPAMEETIKQLRKNAPWCKIVVGGAVLTEDYAKQIGADKYAADAMETVRYAEKINDGI